VRYTEYDESTTHPHEKRADAIRQLRMHLMHGVSGGGEGEERFGHIRAPMVWHTGCRHLDPTVNLLYLHLYGSKHPSLLVQKSGV
jgi:hypothetical protein